MPTAAIARYLVVALVLVAASAPIPVAEAARQAGRIRVAPRAGKKIAAPAPRPTAGRLRPGRAPALASGRVARALVRGPRAVAGGTRALVRGTLVDGPRHTLKAIRRNPVAFGLGTIAIGTAGAVARALGLDGEYIAVALSGAAVLAQVKAAWPTLVKARGRDLVRRIGADVLWPGLLFAISFGAGHAIGGHGAAAHAPDARDLVTAFVSSAVIGGDAPAVGVTALDTRRGGDGH